MAISRQMYNQVMMLDNFTCVYCGLRTPEITVDHYVPQVQGGPDVIANLFACCAMCNSQKSDRPAYELGMTPMYGRFAFVQERLQQQWLSGAALARVATNARHEARRLVYEEGLSIREAARRVGRAESTLREWFKVLDSGDDDGE